MTTFYYVITRNDHHYVLRYLDPDFSDATAKNTGDSQTDSDHNRIDGCENPGYDPCCHRLGEHFANLTTQISDRFTLEGLLSSHIIQYGLQATQNGCGFLIVAVVRLKRINHDDSLHVHILIHKNPPHSDTA